MISNNRNKQASEKVNQYHEQCQIRDASRRSSWSVREDEDDDANSSSNNDNNSQQRPDDDNDDDDSLRKLAKQESKGIRLWKGIVVVTILVTAALISFGTFNYVKQSEEDEFETSVSTVLYFVGKRGAGCC